MSKFVKKFHDLTHRKERDEENAVQKDPHSKAGGTIVPAENQNVQKVVQPTASSSTHINVVEDKNAQQHDSLASRPPASVKATESPNSASIAAVAQNDAQTHDKHEPEPTTLLKPNESVLSSSTAPAADSSNDMAPDAEIGDERTANSFSQALWDDAYDSIKDEELLQNYNAVLRRYFEGDNKKDISVAEAIEISAKLNKRSERQRYMEDLVASGKARIEKSSKVSKVVGDVANGILVLKPVMEIVLKVPQAAPAALPWAGMLGNPGKATAANVDGMTHVVNRMEWYSLISENLLQPSKEDSRAASLNSILQNLTPRVVQLFQSILMFQMKSICSYYRNLGYNFLLQMVNHDDWEASKKSIIKAEEDLLRDWKKYDELKASKVSEELLELTGKVEALLGDISQTLGELIVEEKQMHSEEKISQCLRDLLLVSPMDNMDRIEDDKEKLVDAAYQWIFSNKEYTKFTNWTDLSLLQNRLLWIKGDAGTGKTMLLMGIIRQLSGSAAVFSPSLSYFFCQSKDKTTVPLNSLTAALRTLIWVLVMQQPKLIPHLQKQYESRGKKLFTNMDAQQAMLRIFENMLKDAEPVYFIVDALDECEEGLDAFIELIATSLYLSPNVRWLISSRREVNLVEKMMLQMKSGRLNKVPRKDGAISASLQEIHIQSQQERVTRYIDQKLDDLTRSEFGETYTEDILKVVKKEISQRTEDNLLWAYLVFEDLKIMGGDDAVKNITDYPPGLSKLYDHKMTNLRDGGTKHLEWCYDVLVITSLAYRPLALHEISALVPWSTKLHPRTIVSQCKAFVAINQDKLVTSVHKSARDYILDVYNEFNGGNIHGHVDIAECSLSALRTTLKTRNVYGLKHYGITKQDVKRPEQAKDPLAPIEYSCVYWAEHLCVVDYSDARRLEEVMKEVKLLEFLNECFLFWLESLSLLGQVAEGSRALRKLESIVKNQKSVNPGLLNSVDDAGQFILHNASMITRLPLQTYASALAFSPAGSSIREKQWRLRSPGIVDVKGSQRSWSHLMQTVMNDDKDIAPFVGVVFSHDNLSLATISNTGAIMTWDVITGQLKQAITSNTDHYSLRTETPEKFPECFPQGIDFSPDDSILAAISMTDTSVRLWNVETAKLEKTLENKENPDEPFHLVAFSPNGFFLATASNTQIQLWNLATTSCERVWTGITQAVAFSADSTLLATGLEESGSYPIKIWNAIAGDLEGSAMHGHRTAITTLAFSPDLEKKLLASGSDESSVRVWDISTCLQQDILEDKYEKFSNGAMKMLAFARDGKELVSWQQYGVSLWDMSTMRKVKKIADFAVTISPVAISADTKTVTACHGRSFKFWHTNVAGDNPSSGPGDSFLPSEHVFGMAFSPDGGKLALGTRQTVYIWDVVKNALDHILDKTWTMAFDKLFFSSDGMTLAVLLIEPDVDMDTNAIQLYDVRTKAKGPKLDWLKGTTVTISIDHSMLAAISTNESIQLWNMSASTGTKVRLPGTIHGKLAFSPNGRHLACLIGDTITIWDDSGACVNTLASVISEITRPDRIHYFAISPGCDNIAIVGNFWGYFPSRWNLGLVDRNGSVTNLGDVKLFYNKVAFSNSGGILAAQTGKDIQFWNVAVDPPELLCSVASSQHVSHLSFSADDSTLNTNMGPMKTPLGTNEVLTSDKGTKLAIQDGWIVQGEPLIWVPTEYRPDPLQDPVMVSGDRMVIAHNKEGCSLFHISSG
ncbi:hypothetical protein BT63DRAFT_458310 [Microthyrium microscopicum]|uniref:NACHT domain-containing protein n=1 Tax=Microthyrium microscopicum TaxID=703497 RepID=A0A6A6U0W4_9PEZI|nr:hypothetical protein BT63DRAFT_458310 [Microthyrium microscopicum]